MENIIYSPTGNISLRINEDKMSAWMYVHKSNCIIDEYEILNMIDDAGIVNGFDEALEWIAQNGFNKDFDKPFPVAICKTTMNKESINILFDKNLTYSSDKPISLKDIQFWKAVEPGEALAEMSENMFEDGNSIYNIFGEPAVSVSRKAFLTSYLGDNVSIDSDGKNIVSDVTGFPYLNSDNKISVIDKLIYTGDIKFQKLAFTIPISMEIEGTISKSLIGVHKNLILKGDINNSDVYVDGDLDISGEITNCQGTGIIVNKDLSVNNILNSLVICKGNIRFENSIYNSRVIANKGIFGNPESSSITTSQVMSGDSIDVSSIGDENKSESEIEISISPYIKERITQMQKTLSAFGSSALTSEDKIEQVNKKVSLLEEEMARDMNTYLSNTEGKNNTKYVKIRDELYKGVYIRILSKSIKVKQNQSNIEYTEA